MTIGEDATLGDLENWNVRKAKGKEPTAMKTGEETEE